MRGRGILQGDRNRLRLNRSCTFHSGSTITNFENLNLTIYENT
ncbi:MAG: hypothetical protein BWY82_02252 [Verrucomicrobia bacterium ADurb.Bin474]|nr:MAG: hypothetical protein BWY82_02252 [Verrucomicrobia bacterium ADurb.Bin474]